MDLFSGFEIIENVDRVLSLALSVIVCLNLSVINGQCVLLLVYKCYYSNGITRVEVRRWIFVRNAIKCGEK